MTSDLTILVLSCWLAGQSGVLGHLSYLKPSISLSPSEGFAPGGAVTIRCRCSSGGGRVLLSKAGDPAAQRAMDPTEDMAEFRIRNLSQRDAGSYSCQCGARGDPNIWSEPSNPVELVVAGGTNMTQLRTAPPLTHPGSMEPGTRPGDRRSTSPPRATGGCELNWSGPIITGMIAGSPGFLLLLLLLAFICYRRTRASECPSERRVKPAAQQGKEPAARQSRESEAEDTVSPGARP